ncbi:hypothetical protein COU36_04020 [Candidatus Micrarchaeota archaeon CG10_big_fil_rev_8_21_14_0_10_59_7]|nr:MAG: hypothetical protein COU36_04020 [Candidatus Micrarchaeota archaeon CG10_big_fil_rev_8_21_14_0_10_59_7]
MTIERTGAEGDTIEIRREEHHDTRLDEELRMGTEGSGLSTIRFHGIFAGPKDKRVVLHSGESIAAYIMHILHTYLETEYPQKHPDVSIRYKFPVDTAMLPEVTGVVKEGPRFVSPETEYKIAYRRVEVPRKITLHRTLPHK